MSPKKQCYRAYYCANPDTKLLHLQTTLKCVSTNELIMLLMPVKQLHFRELIVSQTEGCRPGVVRFRYQRAHLPQEPLKFARLAGPLETSI